MHTNATNQCIPMQQVCLKAQRHPLQVGPMQHFSSRISHSVQPAGIPAVAKWQAFAQQYLLKTLWKKHDARMKDLFLFV